MDFQRLFLFKEETLKCMSGILWHRMGVVMKNVTFRVFCMNKSIQVLQSFEFIQYGDYKIILAYITQNTALKCLTMLEVLFNKVFKF